MIKFGLVNFLGISIPEEFFLLLMVMLTIGYKEILNFRNRQNLIKIVAATLLTALFTNLTHVLLEQIPQMVILQIVFFLITYSIIFKKAWYGVLIGHLIAIIGFLFMDFGSFLFVSYLKGMDYNRLIDIYFNTPNMILYTLPSRFLQFIACIGLYKMPFPLVRCDKIRIFTLSIIKKLTSANLALFCASIITTDRLQFFIREFKILNFNDFIYMVVILLAVVGFYIFGLMYAVKTSKKINLENMNINHNIEWFESLLDKHGSDIMAIREELKNSRR